MAEMTDAELVSWISTKLQRCLNDDDGELSDTRQESLDYYLGEQYGNERDGHSKVVTRECFEAVEWALPSILRPFTSGDMVAEFEPFGPEDEEVAKQETEILNYHLMNQNDWFMTVYEWAKDGLMYPNGYIKVWMDKTQTVSTEDYSGLMGPELLSLQETSGIELVAGESYMDEATGAEFFNVRIKRTEERPRLRIAPVPPEELLIDADHTRLSLEEVPFICHETQRDYTWLVQNGIPAETLDDISPGEEEQTGGERDNRLFYSDENPDEEDNAAPGRQKYWVREVYAQIDYDGDGIAEWRRILLINKTVVENDEYSGHPFVAWSSIPMQHKHAGVALLEAVKEIQLVKSTLIRNILDNCYRINAGRHFVGEAALVDGGMTIEAMQNLSAEIIPVRQIGQIMPESTPSIVGDLLPVVNFMDEARKARTGVAPDLSLNPDALKTATMGAFMGALDQAAQRIELVTRVFAEVGIRELMLKAHRLMREHMNIPLAVKLRGKWVSVNPADWKERYNLKIQVGLGFNGKQQKIAALQSILQIQQQAVQGGLADQKGIYNALDKLVDAYGFGNGGEYFVDPDTLPPPEPPQPTDAEKIAMMQAEIERERLALDRERLQLEREKMLSADRMNFAKIEDMIRTQAAKITELELKYNHDVPGSLV